MIDIVFIMLIFFIVTTSFVRESGIDVQRPSSQTGEAQENASILVGINVRGEVWIDQRAVDIRAVRASIERLRAQNPQSSVIVSADRNVTTGLLVQVMDQIRLAGVMNAAVATESAQ
jgi:biopolymer transport protein ExbD